MALAKAIYQAFEDVVGKNNISDDPGILETYRCATAQSSAHYGPFDHRTPTPQAVICRAARRSPNTSYRIM